MQYLSHPVNSATVEQKQIDADKTQMNVLVLPLNAVDKREVLLDIYKAIPWQWFTTDPLVHNQFSVQFNSLCVVYCHAIFN